MSTMSLRLPESLHQQAKLLASQEGVSINQLVATALAEKIAALKAEDYLLQRAAQGNRKKYDRALNKVKKVQPEGQDQLPRKG